MPHTATVTAKTGPNLQNTAMAYPDIKELNLDFVAKTAQIKIVQGVGDNIKEYELSNTTTITIVNTAGVFAVTIA